MQPTLTVSGYRGIWGETITMDIARAYARAFLETVRAGARSAPARILVGRDGRTSGPDLMEAVIEELLACGADVIDLGMMPTPSVLFLVRSEQADGAIIITASHNPIEYNGLKFANAHGAFTTEAEVAAIKAALGANGAGSAHAEPAPASLPRGTRTDGAHLFEKHIAAILAHVDTNAIREKHFKVAIDPINSVGCTTTPKLLAELGATCAAINGEATGEFVHEPEPVAKNLTALQTFVKETGADIGFAQDPDGDRLVLVDETGAILSEECALPLALMTVLARTPGDIVINLSTSNVSEDIATRFGGKTFRSKVGEANVVAGIAEHHAVIGGEGSAGPIWPAVNGTRDSFVAMSLILELMARDNKSLSQLAAELPKYVMTKEKMPRTGSLDATYAAFKAAFPNGTANELDGLRLDFPDRSWVHVRPSNTEPIVRIFTEAPSDERSREITATLKTIALS